MDKIRPMTDAEAKTELEKRGGYAAYREEVLADTPLEKPSFVQKSAQELTVERFQYFAKKENLSLEQWLLRHPAEYREYLKL